VKKNYGSPMTLANMRANGVRAVSATCEACGHTTDVNVDAVPENVTVPETGRRLRCGHCGGKQISARPARHTATQQPLPSFRAYRPEAHAAKSADPTVLQPKPPKGRA
jgi:hypothetical protein